MSAPPNRRYFNLLAHNPANAPIPAVCVLDIPTGSPSPASVAIVRATVNTSLIPICRASDLAELQIGTAQLSNLGNASIASLGAYWIGPGSGAFEPDALYSLEQFCEIANFTLRANLPTGAVAVDAPQLSLNAARDHFVLTQPNAAYRLVCNAAAHTVLGCGWKADIVRGRPFYSVVLGTGQQERTTIGALNTATAVMISSDDLGAVFETTGSAGSSRVTGAHEQQLTDVAYSGGAVELLLAPNFERTISCVPALSGLSSSISVRFSYRDARGEVRQLFLPPRGRASVKLALDF